MKMNEAKSGERPVRRDDGREKRPSCERQWESQPSDTDTLIEGSSPSVCPTCY